MENLFAILIPALIAVESGGDPNAVGKNGEIGILQISDICLEDVNRICKALPSVNCRSNLMFDPNNRLNPFFSQEICKIYLTYYMRTPMYSFDTRNKSDKIQWFNAASRIWNGGPNGYKQDCTLPYWEKVKAEIEKQQPAKGETENAGA